MAPTKERPATKTIATNREARHEYFVLEALETGVELKGTEVKSLRAGGVNLKDSWVDIEDGELLVKGMPISAYSHGMKQKLAIISALLHEPKLILMDEPFVGLDPLAAHQLKTLMRRFCDGGGAIFFSTHVLEVAEKLCDRVAIIRAGRLVRAGSMDEVRGDDSLEEVFLELEGTEAQA